MAKYVSGRARCFPTQFFRISFRRILVLLIGVIEQREDELQHQHYNDQFDNQPYVGLPFDEHLSDKFTFHCSTVYFLLMASTGLRREACHAGIEALMMLRIKQTPMAMATVLQFITALRAGARVCP